GGREQLGHGAEHVPAHVGYEDRRVAELLELGGRGGSRARVRVVPQLATPYPHFAQVNGHARAPFPARLRPPCPCSPARRRRAGAGPAPPPLVGDGRRTRHDRDCVTIGQLSTPWNLWSTVSYMFPSGKVIGLGSFTLFRRSYIYPRLLR